MNPSSSASSSSSAGSSQGGETPATHLVELTSNTLQVLKVDAGAVTLSRNAALDNKAILELLLNDAAADWQENGWSAAVSSFPPATSWHVVTEEQVRSTSGDATLGALAGTLPHGFSGDTFVAGCTAGKGAPVETGGENRWLVAVAPTEGLDKVLALAERCKLRPNPIGPGALDHIGAISHLLRVTGQESVALWDLGLERSHLFLVSSNGVEAVVPCELKLSDIWETIRAELNLKYQLAAARLFYGDLFDFTDAAPRIAGQLAPALTNALAALPHKGEKPALACSGLTATQNWLVNHLAAAIGTTNWQPDPETALSELGLHVAGDLLPGQLTPATFGLLHRASANAKGSVSWKPVWHPAATANFRIALPVAAKPATPAPRAPEPVKAAVPAPAPKPATPAPAPRAPEPVKAATPIPAPKPAPIPTPIPAPKPAAKAPTPVPRPAQPAPAPRPVQPTPPPAPVVKAPAPAPAPAAKVTPPAPQPAKPAQPAPAVKITPPPAKPAAQPAPAAKVTPPAPQPSKPAPQPAPAAKAPAPAPTKVSQPTSGQPAAAKKKAPIGAIAGIIAVVAIAGAAFWFVQNNKAKEQARLAAVEQAAAAQREADAKKAAEAKKIADEQRAATERELARLRKDADDAKRKAAEEADKRRQYEETLARAPGLIKINTNPEGAEVSVDGATPQVTPAIITEVAPGLRRVTVRLPGYETVEQLAEVKNTQALDLGTITLQRVYGELMLRSEPADAEFAVYESDKLDAAPVRTGRTPSRVDNLLPGEYVIKFSRQGLLPTTEHATIAGKEVIDVNSTFIVGGVSITSNPVGATVRMNGENIGITPIVRPELLPGRATFEFTLPNHEPLKLSGEITNKDTLRLHADLLHVDRIAKMSEVKSPPRVLEKATPEIPSDLGEIKGEVVISLVVTKQGTIRDIRVDKSTNPALTEPCLKAINQWKFGPAISKAGLPVNMRIAIPIPIDIKQQQEIDDRPLSFRN